MQTATKNSITPKSVIKIDAKAKVMGKALYAADYSPPDLWHLKLVRCYESHAKILELDFSALTSELNSHNLIIFTAKDFPKNSHGNILKDTPVLANDVVRFYGEPVALIAAKNKMQAEQAATKVKIKTKPLPILNNITEAIAGKPLLCELNELNNNDHHETSDVNETSGVNKISGVNGFSAETSNILSHLELNKGEVSQGFAASKLIVQGKFMVPPLEHAYLEPEAATSWFKNSGYMPKQGKLDANSLKSEIKLETANLKSEVKPNSRQQRLPMSDPDNLKDDVLIIAASTQSPFADQEELARIFKLPLDKFQVFAPSVGGAFGGKDGLTAQAYVAAVSLKTGQPAQLVFSREESLLTSYKRHGTEVQAKLGVDDSGKILAYQCFFQMDTGAYACLGPAVLALAFEHSSGPYAIANLQLDAKLVRTNKAPASAFRGFGAPQVLLAIETLLNRAAKQLNISSIAIRLRNALTQNSVGIFNQPLHCEVKFTETLEAMTKSQLWQESQTNTNPYIGYGLASGLQSCGLGRGLVDKATVSITEIKAETGYKVRVAVGTVDYGQGTATLFAQLASNALNIPIQDIEIIMGNTATTEDCGSTAASRTGMVCGQALLLAAEDFLAKKNAAKSLVPNRNGNLAQNINESSSDAKVNNPIQGRGSFKFPEVAKELLDPRLGEIFGLPHSVFTFMTQLVKIQLEPKTLAWAVKAVHTCLDAGQVINPSNFEGQVQGGIVMGLGGCLGEELTYVAGIPMQRNLANYLLPTTLDIPKMTLEVVHGYEPAGPYGLKGMAEAASIAMAPAILGALESCSAWTGAVANLKETATNLNGVITNSTAAAFPKQAEIPVTKLPFTLLHKE